MIKIKISLLFIPRCHYAVVFLIWHGLFLVFLNVASVNACDEVVEARCSKLQRCDAVATVEKQTLSVFESVFI